MGRTARRATAVAIIFAAAGGLAPTSAWALDEDVMTNILSPIYLAKNLTAVCVKLDESFVEDTRGTPEPPRKSRNGWSTKSSRP